MEVAIAYLEMDRQITQYSSCGNKGEQEGWLVMPYWSYLIVKLELQKLISNINISFKITINLQAADRQMLLNSKYQDL